MKGARIHANIGPTHKTSFSLMLPCALMGEQNAPLSRKQTAMNLTSRLQLSSQVPKSTSSSVQASEAPAVMGTFDDARMLAKYALMGGGETELLHHRGVFVSGSTSRFLALIGQHSGFAPLKELQRADLSPFEVPTAALPGGRASPEHPASLAMGTHRYAVWLREGSWVTTIHGSNRKQNSLVVPPPPHELAQLAKQGVLLDVVLACDVDLDTVPYTYVRRDFKRPVSKARGVILARPQVLRDAIFRCRAMLALKELEKDWSTVQEKPSSVQVDLALAGGSASLPLSSTPSIPAPPADYVPVIDNLIGIDREAIVAAASTTGGKRKRAA